MLKLQDEDFVLDQAQLDLINNYIEEQSELFGAEGVAVIFRFDNNRRLIEVCHGQESNGIKLS